MLRFFLMVSALFFLSSCGGNDDESYERDPYYNDGYYYYSYFHIKDLDNFQYRVGNIKYDCGLLEGITDNSGMFEYEDGANCVFTFDYNNTTYELGVVDSDTIDTSNIYVFDLQNVTDERLLNAITDAMHNETLKITRY
ncbi:MAG: hypothetical protein KU38_03125 [Sulfurovum sp. FS08-3]|nr:MAG: hypothetical protein KU38_03125 [Sulfurovum sp. FS08-3]